jgi:hypothetical protein
MNKIFIRARRDRAHSLPLKIGFPANNSAKMQPTDHTSIAEAYQQQQQKKKKKKKNPRNNA